MHLARQNGLLQDYDNEQIEILTENINNVLEVAKMRALGRDRWGPEQYKLAFMIKHGIIKLPAGDKPLWDPEAHMMGESDESAIKRGLFNVRRWLGTVKGGQYLRYHQDPFPDLPNLDQWDAQGGTALASMFGAGSKGPRWDQFPRTPAAMSSDVASRFGA